ncbi:MAG: DUF5130 family protein [Pseudonocardia sp.]|jgi:hypothetical protein
MVAGELTRPERGSEEHSGSEAADLPAGAVVTGSGRVSAAADMGAEPEPSGPFSPTQLARLDEALTLVSRHTRLRFSVFLGELDGPARPAAERLHDEMGADGAAAVLIAIDPTRRELAIVTGPEAKIRLPDRACHLAVMSMTASFSEGDLVGGLLSGLRMLSDQAGAPA